MMKVIKSAICIIVITIMVSCKKENSRPGITIPNGDFESWTNDNRLQNWVGNSCPLCVPPYETYIIQKDSAAYHGKYDAKFIYNNVYPARAENEFNISVHPVNLSAYVKTAIYGADTVSIKISLLKNSKVVDSGQWLGVSSIGNYRKIMIPVTQSSTLVDSARITIVGGHNKINYPANGTMFWVDNLELQ